MKKPRSNNKDPAAGNWRISKELTPNCSVTPTNYIFERCRAGRTEELLHTVRLGYDQAATSDGSGTLATVFSNSPSAAQNWAGYAAVFDSYRVLGMIVEFEPFWTVNCTFAPIASVVDRSDGTALTGYGLAERYESHKKVPGKKPWTQVVPMSGTEESQFVSTTTVAANNWIKMYTTGNTSSFTFGRFNVTLLVQFRGVGIN